MKIQYIGPAKEVRVPKIGKTFERNGEAHEVDEKIGKNMLENKSCWTLLKGKAVVAPKEEDSK